MMRIAFVGVGHWHIKFYLPPQVSLAGTEIVGVSDPVASSAAGVARQLGCAAYTDYREMCRTLKPDFVFALGRHCDMAAQGEFLVDEGIPFALEKPCGMSYAQVSALAERAARKGAFASATFGFGHTEPLERFEEIARDDRLEYVSMRAIGGSPQRYENVYRPAVGWVLDPAQSGGGPLINLSIHYLQLFRRLVRGARVSVRAAMISNRAYGLPVEDYAALGTGQIRFTDQAGEIGG